jgi:hypothetical protein
MLCKVQRTFKVRCTLHMDGIIQRRNGKLKSVIDLLFRDKYADLWRSD